MTATRIPADWSELSSDWRDIWAAGGRILVRRGPDGPVFDGSIVVERHDRKFFYLVVEVDSSSSPQLGLRVGDSAHSFGQFIPPIQRVRAFPESLALGALLGPLEKRLAIEQDRVTIETAAGALHVCVDPKQPEALTLRFSGPAAARS
jgi:hypothetical protein